MCFGTSAEGPRWSWSNESSLRWRYVHRRSDASYSDVTDAVLRGGEITLRRLVGLCLHRALRHAVPSARTPSRFDDGLLPWGEKPQRLPRLSWDAHSRVCCRVYSIAVRQRILRRKRRWHCGLGRSFFGKAGGSAQRISVRNSTSVEYDHFLGSGVGQVIPGALRRSLTASDSGRTQSLGASPVGVVRLRQDSIGSSTHLRVGSTAPIRPRRP